MSSNVIYSILFLIIGTWLDGRRGIRGEMGGEERAGGTVTFPISGVQDSLPLMKSHQAALSPDILFDRRK